MKLDAIRSGKNNTHVTYLLRESYREGGKVKNRTVANVSHLPAAEIEALRLALKLKGELPRLLAGATGAADTLGVRQGLSYGAVRGVQAVMARQAGFWDYEEHLARLTKGGDPLVTLAEVVDFEPFRYRLEKALKRSDGAKGGRPPLAG